MSYSWTYQYKVGSVQHFFNAPNRKAADALAAQHGIPRTAYVGRH